MSETESAQGIAEGYRRARVIEEREGGKYAAFAWFQHGDSCRRVAENWVSRGLEGTSGVGTYLPTSESLCLSSLAFEGGAPRVKPMTNYRLCRCGRIERRGFDRDNHSLNHAGDLLKTLWRDRGFAIFFMLVTWGGRNCIFTSYTQREKILQE